MRRILAASCLLAALSALAAPARAAQAPADRGATPVATSALLALVPNRATIAGATLISPTALVIIGASAVGSGTISPSGQVQVLQGSDQTFTMTGSHCVVVGNVRVDGTDLGPLTTYTFHGVSSNHTIVATFVPAPPDTIVASAAVGGTISPAGPVAYDCGASAGYTITPNDCFAIGDVVVDGVSQGPVPAYTFKDLQGPHTILASFVPTKTTITATPLANGTMTPAGVVEVDCGVDQTFSITPKVCYRIADVVVDGTSQGPITSYTFTNVRAHHSITASFASTGIRDTITAVAGTGGTIAPAGAVVVDCGSGQTFAIANDACYRIADVVVDGISQGPVTSYTFTDITAAHTITASFASTPQYPITAAAGFGGTIVPSGIIQVDCGASQTFTITNGLPFSHAQVVVDGIPSDSVASYTFTNVHDAHSIFVQFLNNFEFFVQSRSCTGSIQIKPLVLGGPLNPNSTYWYDVLPLNCAPPAPGTALAKAGSVQTDASGSIIPSTGPCYAPRVYTLVLDVQGNGVYDAGVDPFDCFQPGGSVAANGIQELSGEITPEGAVLSWWLMDLSAYRGFVVHRAPEGGEEEVVTPAPLAPPASHPPAQMRWRDGAAVPGARYAYRIEALKPSGSDWYGPVRLTIPAAPQQLALRGATPNPFSGTTRLALDLPAGEGGLRLDVFDVAGRHVRTLRPGPLSPGQDVVEWDGLDDHGAPARGGLYVVRLQGARGTRVLRIMKVD